MLMHDALDTRLVTTAILNKVALRGDRVLTILHTLAKNKERKVGPKTHALVSGGRFTSCDCLFFTRSQRDRNVSCLCFGLQMQRFLEFEARVMSCGFTPACHRPKLICW